MEDINKQTDGVKSEELEEKFTLKNDDYQAIVNKWIGLGLLEKVEDLELLKIMAFAYEYAATYILLTETIGKPVFNQDTAFLSFPIIRRILGRDENPEILLSGNKDINFNESSIWFFTVEVINGLDRILNKLKLRTIEIDPTVDIFGEFCGTYTEPFALDNNRLKEYFN